MKAPNDMKIQVISKTNNTMRLIIEGTDAAFMNTLRRIMLTEVPCMAIDDIFIVENSSVFDDEILAHRLGFVPLVTDLDSYNLPEECTCKSELGCNLCRVTLTLDAEATDGKKTLYSGDLVSENPNIKPVSDKILIAKLAPDQRIKLEAYARLGKGKNHAKWQPISMCAYKNLPLIDINVERCSACGECVNVCPQKLLALVGKRMEIHNLLDCTLCGDCVDACPAVPAAIKVTGKEEAFVLEYESNGVLSVERLMFETLKILDKKVEDFISQLATIGTAEQQQEDKIST